MFYIKGAKTIFIELNLDLYQISFKLLRIFCTWIKKNSCVGVARSGLLLRSDHTERLDLKSLSDLKCPNSKCPDLKCPKIDEIQLPFNAQ